jgi:hypothetical protein
VAHEDPTQDHAADPRRLVLVLGPGRSGTSTIAGALAMTGLEVPGRAVKANETNPSGFYEPRWVVDFHKRLLDESRVNTLDTAPEALELVVDLTSRQPVRDELRSWLEARFAAQPRLVVKDPRTIWFDTLWVDTARELGVEPGFVTMLRHPAEVSASRGTYYSKGTAEQRSADVTRIAGWVNVALMAERATRGSRRVFVRYTDLVADWRKVLERMEPVLGLSLEPGPEVSPHPVDEFIDPSLHRIQVDWSGVDVPEHLRELAEQSWLALSSLAQDGESPDRLAELDELRERYTRTARDAWALNLHALQRAQRTARRKGVAQGRKAAARQAAKEAAQEAARPAGPGRSPVRRVLARLKGGR